MFALHVEKAQKYMGWPSVTDKGVDKGIDPSSLEHVVHHVETALGVFEADGALVVQNPAFEAFLDTLVPKPGGPLLKVLESIVETAVSKTGGPVVHVEGDKFFSVVIKPLKNGWTLCEARDVSEERRLEALKKLAERKVDEILSVSGCFIAELDRLGAIIKLNEFGGVVMNCPPETLIGMRFIDELVEFKDRKWAVQVFDRALRGEPALLQPVEFDLMTLAGERRILRWRASPAEGSAGSPRGVLMSGVDITEHRMTEEQIIFMASHDQITGLPNRALFMDRAGVALAQARRGNLKAGVMFIDLDGFKNVNDTLGHEAGDVLLKQAANRMVRRVRASDTVARFGGDEFAVLLGNVNSQENATMVAESILKELSRDFEIKGTAVSISGSIGLSFFPDDAEVAEDLIRLADGAMYAVKRSGKRGVRTARDSVAL